jgi:CubicO group peptidase (beta-lactamase class C family)
MEFDIFRGSVWPLAEKKSYPSESTMYHSRYHSRLSVLVVIITSLFILSSCSENPAESISYVPLELNDGWKISTPEKEGVDSYKLRNVYEDAERLSNIYSLIIVKNGSLIGERYFNGQRWLDARPTASVTKSIISALAGICLRENILTSLDQKMMEFFLEIDWPSLDPRKSQITIRQILQMRSGYPWEEFSGDLSILISRSNWIPLLEEFQLNSDPGTQFGYSNLTAHMMAIILARAANTSLLSFAQAFLFNPLDVVPEFWPTDSLGYHFGSGDIELTPRQMAKFGLLYLNNGVVNGSQIIPSEWIDESLTPYSYNVYNGKILANFDLLDYGYMWWSSRVGDYQVHFAWGHGGQMIVLVSELNMVVVSTADHLPGQFGEAAWIKEKAVMELVGAFIASL